MDTQIRLTIEDQYPFAGGEAFGSTGPYEVLKGRVHLAADPDAPEQKVVVDVDKAPRNPEGLVEFTTDIFILKPVHMSQGNSRLLFDFVNRGNKRALQFFNDAPHTNNPKSAADAGNGFLMRRGYTVVWAAWQGDIFPGDGRIVLDVPVATDNDRPITGPVRCEFIADEHGIHDFPLSSKVVIRSYPAAGTDTADATFTRRQYAFSRRIPLDPGEWRFARLDHDPAGQSAIIPCNTHVYLPSGFEPGWIYELVYTAMNPLVLGLGYAGVRDIVSFFKYAEKDSGGASNPLRDGSAGIEKAYCWGRSQSGRTIRDFIHQGFNADGSGRRVFDAAFPHVAGAGLAVTNFRFGQPVRNPGLQHEEHCSYADRFPFSYAWSFDHLTGKKDAILKRPETDPIVFHTQTSTEYWQRRGSLVHTDSSGNDLEQPDTVRVYLWAGSQHWADPLIEAPERGIGQQPNNIMPTSPLFRALLDHLDRWATEGKAPPPSRIPTRGDGTLGTFNQWRDQFPAIPGVATPRDANFLPLYGYGPGFDKGHLHSEPPEAPRDGEVYPVFVPAVDKDGNEIPGIRVPLLQAPLGTYTGWNIRPRGSSPGAMAVFDGSFIPFPATRAEREATGDPRSSIEERYPSPKDYENAIANGVERLANDGFLLEEDAERILMAAKNNKHPYNR
jgi:hypothetical protein